MGSDRIHTLDDLEAWRFDGTALAVLGHPVAHSASPAMHHAALAEMAGARPELARWRYFKFDVEPAGLPRALEAFHRAGFLGLNLTLPHKVVAVGLVRRIDPPAAEAGAVNTLRRLPGGWEGFNTDGYGIVRGVADDLGWAIAGTPVVLLGAGGAARGAAVACLREGCRGLWIANRTAANLEALLRTLAPLARSRGIALAGFDPEQPPADLPADALVINATSAGLGRADPPPIALSAFPGTPRVYDMIYNPPETALLRAASARGLRSAGGVSMLVHQGARALELWTGRPVPAAAMRAACLRVLGRPPAASA
jgi:shikimate dehydrogenase